MSDDLILSVQLVSTARDLPVAANGQATLHSSEIVELDMASDMSHLADGDLVILTFPDAEMPRMEAVVREVKGTRLLCSSRRLREAERRDYPRLHAGLPLRFRVLRGADRESLASSWIEGEDQALSSGDWIQPDEFMNFSVTGLAFEGANWAQADDLLLLEMRFRDLDQPLRATARVIRVFTLNVNQTTEGHSHRTAIQFENMPDSVRQALSNLTLQIQDSFF
jgi:hypothetical protein